MHFYDVDYNYKDEMRDKFIKKEMLDTKQNILERVSAKLHPEYCESILNVLAYGYFEEFKPAMQLSQELRLGTLEYVAIQEDFESFKDIYIDQSDYDIGGKDYE